MEIRVLNENPVVDYRQTCKVTQGIELDIDSWKPKDEIKWWIKQIVANHSTLRCVKFRIIDEAPKSVVMQIIRATKGHPQPEVESSRPDWTGKERSSNPYENKMFCIDHTAESFVEMAKQRLCSRTEEKTRKYMQKLVTELKNSKDPFLCAVGYCCHPACWWLNGCPEIKCCSDNVDKISEKVIKECEKCRV